MLAESMVVLQHLLIRSHVEISFEPIQITICQLVARSDDTADFYWVTTGDMLHILVRLVVYDLYFFVYIEKAQLAKSLIGMENCRNFEVFL